MAQGRRLQVSTNKMHDMRAEVKFSLGQNEGCSLGDSTSGAQRLLQRGSGGQSIGFHEGGVQCNQCLLCQVSDSHEEAKCVTIQGF